MTIGEKIIAELNKQGKSQKSLAQYIGVSDTAIGKWKTKPQDIKFENVVKASEFLGVSLDYLAYGKEPTIPTEYKKLISSYQKLSPENQKMALSLLNTMYDVQVENEKRSEIKPITIKLMYNKVSAGKGYDLNDEDGENIQIPDSPDARKADFAVTVDGNSMETMFYDGDIVLIKQQESIDIGQIGIFIVDKSEGFIKQLGEDRLISLNPECDDIIFTNHDTIDCCGLVLGTTEKIG